MDQLGLVQPVDRLGQRVVVAVALAADRRFDARFGQPLGIVDADILQPAIRVTDEGAFPLGLPGVQGLLQGIEHEIRAHGAASEGCRRSRSCCIPGRRISAATFMFMRSSPVAP